MAFVATKISIIRRLAKPSGRNLHFRPCPALSSAPILRWRGLWRPHWQPFFAAFFPTPRPGRCADPAAPPDSFCTIDGRRSYRQYPRAPPPTRHAGRAPIISTTARLLRTVSPEEARSFTICCPAHPIGVMVLQKCKTAKEDAPIGRQFTPSAVKSAREIVFLSTKCTPLPKTPYLCADTLSVSPTNTPASPIA